MSYYSITIIITWFIPRKFATAANAHLEDSTEEECYQFIFNMSSDMSGERSLFVRHLLMFENFKNFEKFKTLIHN